MPWIGRADLIWIILLSMIYPCSLTPAYKLTSYSNFLDPLYLVMQNPLSLPFLSFLFFCPQLNSSNPFFFSPPLSPLLSAIAILLIYLRKQTESRWRGILPKTQLTDGIPITLLSLKSNLTRQPPWQLISTSTKLKYSVNPLSITPKNPTKTSVRHPNSQRTWMKFPS